MDDTEISLRERYREYLKSKNKETYIKPHSQKAQVKSNFSKIFNNNKSETPKEIENQKEIVNSLNKSIQNLEKLRSKKAEEEERIKDIQSQPQLHDEFSMLKDSDNDEPRIKL